MSNRNTAPAKSADGTMSKQLKLTNGQIDRLKPRQDGGGAREDEYSDTVITGLKVTVNRKGKKAFLLRYTHNGSKRCIKIGDYPMIRVEEARDKAQELKRQVAAGQVPLPVRNTAAVLTLEQFCKDDYLPWSRENKRSSNDDESKLKTHLYRKLGKLPLQDVSARDIQQYLSYLRGQGLAPATANRHLSLLSSVFRLAEQFELVTKNPCKPVQKFKENNQRQRYLSEDELSRLLEAMDDTDPQTGEKNRVAVAALKLMLVTGARREEVMNAQWQHIDLDKRQWFLPKTKNGKSRFVPLNDAALEVLAGLKSAPGCPFVFVNPKTGMRLNTPVKAFHRLLGRAGITDFRIHDLRHSFASLAVNQGTSLYVVQQLLGHASSATTQRYAHLCDDTLLSASNQVAGTVRNARSAA